MAWMSDKGFFDTTGINLDRQDVFMEGTRWAKLNRIRGLGCSYFVDDLEEIFLDQEFPDGTQSILYSTAPNPR